MFSSFAGRRERAKSTQLDILCAKVDKCIASNNSREKSIDNLSRRSDENFARLSLQIAEQYKEFSKRMDAVEQRLEVLESAAPSDASENMLSDPILKANMIFALRNELRDLESRSQNLVLTGIPDEGDDVNKVNSILRPIDQNLVVSNVRRLGNDKNSANPRMLLVTLPEKNDLAKVFTSKALPQGIQAKSDRPKFHREYVKQLHGLVNKHNAENPRDNLKVMHKRGTPVAVDLKNVARNPKNLKQPLQGLF